MATRQRPGRPQTRVQGRSPAPASAARRAIWAAADWGGGGLPLTALIVSVLGLAVSVYLTIEHFTQNSYAGCPATSTINCAKVTTSPQSQVLGIPVAVLGLAFFVFMVAVNSPWGWRARPSAVHWARLASVIIGMAFVLYLIYAELFLINAICLYCTAVHALTFVLFGLIVTKAALSGARSVPPRPGG